MPKQTLKGCFETARTLNNSNSQSNLGLQSSNYTQYETMKDENHPAQLTSIKTELKDKILMTRERFNQLKSRKRHNQLNSDGVSCMTTTATTIGTTRNHNIYNSFRSNSKPQNASANGGTGSFGNQGSQKSGGAYKREDSQNSDNVDRDEESMPNLGSTLSNLNMYEFQLVNLRYRNSKNQTMKYSLKTGVKASYYKSQQPIIASYKLDGAKLLVNRLQIQFKNRFDYFIESVNQMNHESSHLNVSSQQLKEKWKFVRNVMDNMDRHKKQPLSDKTNNLQSQPPHGSNFTQIQKMFENFKSLRSSGSQNSKQNQENQNPIYTLTTNIPKISSQSKDAIPRKKNKNLPPYSKKAFNNTNTVDLRTMQQLEQQPLVAGMRESADSFTSTFRENEYFINYNNQQDLNTLPNQMLTSRSNLVLEDDTHEGLQQLPLESPMNTDKFIQRRLLLKQDQLQQIEVFRHQLQRLSDIQNKIKVRQSFAGFKKRSRAHQTLKKLINRRIQEEKVKRMTNMKSAFVTLIKNCIFKSRFSYFLERAKIRLLEKGFDKIKENNWILDERKELLEAIIIKQKLKKAMQTMLTQSKEKKRTQLLVNLYQNYHRTKDLRECMNIWGKQLSFTKKENSKNEILRAIILKQIYTKQGFQQFKKSMKRQIVIQNTLDRLMSSYEIKIKQNALRQWNDQTQGINEQQVKASILTNLLYLNKSLHLKQCFITWKEDTIQTSMMKKQALSTGIYLFIKPLLKLKERKLKHIAFSNFRHRVTLMNRIKKQFSLLSKQQSHKSSLSLMKFFQRWKHSMEYDCMMQQKLVISHGLTKDDLRLQASQVNYDEEEISQKYSHLMNLPFKSSNNPRYEKSEELQDEALEDSDSEEDKVEENEEDFDNLTEIKRLSYEANLKKSQQDCDESLNDKSSLIKINNRRVSEQNVRGGSVKQIKGKLGQNLRYIMESGNPDGDDFDNQFNAFNNENQRQSTQRAGKNSKKKSKKGKTQRQSTNKEQEIEDARIKEEENFMKIQQEEEEKQAQLTALKKKEEEEQREKDEQERKRKELEQKRLKDEQDKLKQLEDQKRAAEEKQRQLEEQKRFEAEKKKQEEDKRRIQDEQNRQLEEQTRKKEEDMMKIKQEEERKRIAEEKRKKEEEWKRVNEEKRKQEEEERKRLTEQKRLEEEQRKQQEELVRKQKEEDDRKKRDAEEAARLKQEAEEKLRLQKLQEEEELARKKLEQEKIEAAAQEKARLEELQRQAELKRQEEERKKKEDEQKSKAAEELKRQQEEQARKQKEEDEKIKEQERKAAAQAGVDQGKVKQEELKHQADEKKRLEDEQKQKKLKEEQDRLQLQKADEDKLKKEQELKLQKEQEDKQKQEKLLKDQQEEQLRKQQEIEQLKKSKLQEEEQKRQREEGDRQRREQDAPPDNQDNQQQPSKDHSDDEEDLKKPLIEHPTEQSLKIDKDGDEEDDEETRKRKKKEDDETNTCNCLIF